MDARRQKEAVAWVLKNGGTVDYDWEVYSPEDETTVGLRKGTPPGPQWMRRILGDDYLQTVRVVSLPGNSKVPDIAPLAKLTQLQTLYLIKSGTRNISPLAELEELEVVWLTGNQIVDVSPLSGLRKLKYLTVAHNEVSDISPLSSLRNLEGLAIGGNDIQEISALGGMTRLKVLDLSGNPINDFAPLKSLPSLRLLALEENDDNADTNGKLRTALPNDEVKVNWTPSGRNWWESQKRAVSTTTRKTGS